MNRLLLNARGTRKRQGLVPTLPVFKGDCCPEEKKREPGTAQVFPLGLVPLLSMHYPGCWKLIIKRIPSIPATCFLSIACGIEYLTHTSEHQGGCDTSLYAVGTIASELNARCIPKYDTGNRVGVCSKQLFYFSW